MKFTQFLLLLAVNLLTQALPIGFAVYLAMRAANKPRKEGDK